MRKLYLIFALLVWLTLPSGAKIVIGDQITASQITEGALIVIQDTRANSSNTTTDWNGWYFDNTTSCTKLISPNMTWRVVKATADEQGRQQYYLQNLGDSLYMGPMFGGRTAGRYKTCIIDSAYQLRFEDYNQTATTRYTFNEKSVVAIIDFYSYIERLRYQSLDVEPTNLQSVYPGLFQISSASRNGMDGANGSPINVFAAQEVQDYASDLQTQLDIITSANESFPPGTDPGLYDASAVSNYENAITTAKGLLASDSASDQEYIDAWENLIHTYATVKTAIIPVTEGYYYIVSGYDAFLNNQGVEKAMTANDSIAVWETFDSANPEFIWRLTASGDYYNVYNVNAQRYLEHSSGPWSNSSATYMALVNEAPATAQAVTPIGGGFINILAYWPNPAGTYATSNAYWVRGDNGGKNTSGYVGVGGGGLRYPAGYWYLRRVSNDMIQKMDEIIAINNRLKLMQSQIDDARSLVDNILLYKTTGDGLITTAGNGVEGNQITFSTVLTQGIEGSDNYKFLIDNSDSTYMLGAGTISVDISATPTDKVAITYRTRGATVKRPSAGQWGMNERPANVVLYASKSIGADSVWVKIDSTDMSQLGVPAQWYVDLKDTYSYLRLVVKNNATGGKFFTLGEFQLYKYEPDQDNSEYYTVSGMKDAVDALQIQIDSAQNTVAAKSVSDEQIADMQSAIAAVRALYSDTTSLKQLILEAQTLASATVVGDQIGDLADASAATSLQSAITAAQDESLYTAPLNKAGIRQASVALNSAIAAFRTAVRMPDPNKWYYIRSLTSTDVRSGVTGTSEALCFGSMLYTCGNDTASALSWGYVDENGDMTNIYSPSTMWRIVPIEGTDNYALQNLGSGLYLGAFVSPNIATQQSESVQPYTVQLLGNRQFAFTSQASTNFQNLSLYCGGVQTNIIATNAAIDGNGAWGFTEVNVDEIESITISSFANNQINVMTLPYDVSGLADHNDDVHTYGIRKITQEQNAEGELVSTIELYLKDTIRAGEPVIIILGDTAQDVPCEDFDLFFPFPSEVTSTPVAANGLTGVLSEARCAKGTGISTAKKFIPMEQDGNVPSQTGVIDPSKYTGEVTGVETAYTLTAVGLNPLPTSSKADVNNDGEINSADIAVVYNFIANGEQSGYTKDALDVNGDGEVNSSDVANIYAQIAGGDAASNKAKNN